MRKGSRPAGARDLSPQPRPDAKGNIAPVASGLAVDPLLPDSAEEDLDSVDGHAVDGGPDIDGWDHGLTVGEPPSPASPLAADRRPALGDGLRAPAPRLLNFLKWLYPGMRAKRWLLL